jgi:hypothetical protein
MMGAGVSQELKIFKSGREDFLSAGMAMILKSNQPL